MTWLMHFFGSNFTGSKFFEDYSDLAKNLTALTRDFDRLAESLLRLFVCQIN